MAPLESLRITDFSDREVLLILNDVADGEGWASAKDMVERFGFAQRLDRPHRFVAQRLSWLGRYGALEREHEWDEQGRPKLTRSGKLKYTQRWRMTPAGRALAMGKLRTGQQRALEGLTDEQLLVALREVTRHVQRAGETAAVLARREWRYGSAPERSMNGRP
jgi:hypothetical protein